MGFNTTMVFLSTLHYYHSQCLVQYPPPHLSLSQHKVWNPKPTISARFHWNREQWMRIACPISHQKETFNYSTWWAPDLKTLQPFMYILATITPKPLPFSTLMLCQSHWRILYLLSIAFRRTSIEYNYKLKTQNHFSNRSPNHIKKNEFFFFKKKKKRKRSQWESNPRPLDSESNAISTPLCDHASLYFPIWFLLYQRRLQPQARNKKNGQIG